MFNVNSSSASNQSSVIGVASAILDVTETVPGIIWEYVVVPGSESLAPETKLVLKPGFNLDELQSTYKVVQINAVGEGQINVCGENGNINQGDLIVSSSIPGKGMKQADDIVRSYTVAKARESVTFSSANEVKLIACIYLCG